MRITKNLKIEKLKVLSSFAMILLSICLSSQEKKDFYLVSDTIKLNNPILIREHNKTGLYITEKEDFKIYPNIEKLLKIGKAFLYSDTGFSIITSKDRKEKGISIGECNRINKQNPKKKYTTWEFQKNNHMFYLGFITGSKYNKTSIRENDKGKIVDNKNNYYPILFSICKEE